MNTRKYLFLLVVILTTIIYGCNNNQTSTITFDSHEDWIQTNILNDENFRHYFDNTSKIGDLLLAITNQNKITNTGIDIPTDVAKYSVKHIKNEEYRYRRSQRPTYPIDTIERFVYFTFAEIADLLNKANEKFDSTTQLGFRLYPLKYDTLQIDVKDYLVKNKRNHKEFHGRNSIMIALTKNKGKQVIQLKGQGKDYADMNLGQLCPPGCGKGWIDPYN